MAQEPETKAQAIAELSQIVASPAFDQYIRDIENQPKEQQLGFVQKTANISEMKKRGIPVTEGFRIAVRTFENPDTPETFFDNQTLNRSAATGEEADGSWTICASLGYIVCASVGYTPSAT